MNGFVLYKQTSPAGQRLVCCDVWTLAILWEKERDHVTCQSQRPSSISFQEFVFRRLFLSLSSWLISILFNILRSRWSPQEQQLCSSISFKPILKTDLQLQSSDSVAQEPILYQGKNDSNFISHFCGEVFLNCFLKLSVMNRFLKSTDHYFKNRWFKWLF